MGRRKNKREKALKPIDPTSGYNIPALVYKAPEDRTKPSEQPKLIPIATFKLISDFMLETVPPHRNVFLSMCEYRIRDVNPMHMETSDSPTHMIIFCLRLIVSDMFHPIGVVQIDKRIDQTEKLVHVWKTYLQDLSLLRLIVIGSISPPSMTFHKILRELTKIPNMKNYTGPITYSVWPYKEIVHLYDYFYLLHETQEALFERNEMCFMACSPSVKHPSSFQLSITSWTDILLVLTSQGINCYYTSDDRNAVSLDIFHLEFWKTYQQAGKDGLMDTDSKESTDILMELFCPFRTSLQAHKPFMCPYDLQNFYDNNEELRILLATARYKKLTVPFSGGSSPDISTKEMQNESVSPFKAGLKDESSIEIGDNQMNNILKIIDTSLNNVERNSFDIFLQKVSYDDYDLFIKTSVKCLLTTPRTGETVAAKKEEINSIRHDHDYFRKKSPKKSPPKLAGNSTIYNLVNDFFGKDVELLKTSLGDPEIEAEAASKVSKKMSSSSETREKNNNINHVTESDHSYSKRSNLIDNNYIDIGKTEFSDKQSQQSHSAKEGKRKLRGSKVDQLFHAPKRKSRKIKAKRLKSEDAQKLMSCLPYIFSDNLSVGDYTLVSADSLGSEEMCISPCENITESNASNISKDDTQRIPENEKTDNLNNLTVDLCERENGSVLSNLRQKEIINVAEIKEPLIQDNASVQYSDYIPEPDDNTHNKVDGMIKAKISNGWLKEPVEEPSDIGMKIYEKSELNVPDKIDEASVNNRIHKGSLLEDLTNSMLDSAIQDFSNILASYKQALEQSKNGSSDKSEDEVLLLINGCNSQSHEPEEEEANSQNSDSDSTDSLTELLSSFEADPSPAKIPCKYTIPKTSNINIHRLEACQKLDGMDKASDIVTQDVFYRIMHKRSLDLSQTLEETVIKHTLNMLDKTLEQYSQNIEGKPSIANESLPLSNPDSLDDYKSNKTEILTNFVVNTALHENISRMFPSSNKHLGEDVEKPDPTNLDDTGSIPDLEESFLAVANSSFVTAYTDSGLDNENITDTNCGEETYGTFIESSFLSKNEESTENKISFKSVKVAKENTVNIDENNKTFVIEQQWDSTSTGVMPCCKVASTSGRYHSPSSEINNHTCLPHYTRFRKSFSDISSSSTSIDPKESIPKEENNANSTVATNLNVTVDNVFNTESTVVAEAVCDERNGVKEGTGNYESLEAHGSIEDGNDYINNIDDYQPEEPNDYVKYKDHATDFNDSAIVISPREGSFKKESLDSSKIEGNLNIIVGNVLKDGYTAVQEKASASVTQPSDVISEDTEYQPDAPNDNTQCRRNPSDNDENHKREESNDYVDYKEYRRSLEACDNNESKCDIIYKDKNTFERLCSQIPDDFETLRVTNDWLCTFKGYIKLKEILVARKVRQFQPTALSLEHIDFLVHLIKRSKNNISSDYDGSSYTFLDYRSAFDVLLLGKGVYMIRNDTDVNNIGL